MGSLVLSLPVPVGAWQEVALRLLQASPLTSSGLDTGHVSPPPRPPGPASFLAREAQRVGRAPGEAGDDGRSQKSGQASGLQKPSCHSRAQRFFHFPG